MAPVPWNGSQLIYHSVIRPFFLKHHQAVDNMMGDIGTRALDAASSVTREGDSAPLSLHLLRVQVFPAQGRGQLVNVNYRRVIISRCSGQ